MRLKIQNVMLNAQIWLRLFDRLEFFGEGVLDDFDIGSLSPWRQAYLSACRQAFAERWPLSVGLRPKALTL